MRGEVGFHQEGKGEVEGGEAGIANPDAPRGQAGSGVSGKLKLATQIEPQVAE